MVIADLVLKSCNIFTATSDRPFKGGVAVLGNKILAVEKDNDIEKYIGKGTEVYNYDDQLIMPGINDAHLHLLQGATIYDSDVCLDLSSTNSKQECLDMVKDYNEKHFNDKDWIRGVGWYHYLWKEPILPSKTDLDNIVPDRPIFLDSSDGHTAWINSKALEICNITRDTKDPEGGKIGRNKNGEPNGILYDGAGFLAGKYGATPPEPLLNKSLKAFFEKAIRYGITSVSDMMPSYARAGDYEIEEIYKAFEDRGELPLRIHLFSSLGKDLIRAKMLRGNYASGLVRFCGLKQFVDGVFNTYTARLVEPYTDNPSTSGSSYYEYEELKNLIVQADAEGFSVRLHTIGDASVRMGLDCFEAAQKENGKRREIQHTLEHIEVINPKDIPRFEQLGVIASVQPMHIIFDISGAYINLGEERVKYCWPFKSMLESGAQLAFGTDCPVVDLDPRLGIRAAMSRTTDDGYPEGGFIPEEKLTMAEILKAYTYGSACATGRGDELGTLERDKLADIIVVDKNLFELSPAEVMKTKAILTIVDGKVVYKL